MNDCEEMKQVAERRMTEWLPEHGTCGDTAYPTRTNGGWCRCEVERLMARGVRTAVMKDGDGNVAIFKLADDETADDLQLKVAEMMLAISASESREVQNA